MPELPEVETVAKELNHKLKQLVINKVKIITPKMISFGPQTVSNIRLVDKSDVQKVARILTGQKILTVKRRAKMLIFELSGPWTMLVHLKMTGQFIFETIEQRVKTKGQYRILNKKTAPLVELPSKHTHVIFSFTDGSNLYFNDLRKFGFLKLVANNDISQVKSLSDYGPEPLDPNFSFKKFVEKIRSRKNMAIKLGLMDPKVVSGIGNIYSDEILYLAGVRPDRKVSDLKVKELEKIFAQIKPVLITGIKHKGSSVGDFIRTDGSWGSMGKHHFVYGRKKQGCKRCGTIILALKLGGRTGCFCPKCQK